MEQTELDNRIRNVCSFLRASGYNNSNAEISVTEFHNISAKEYLDMCVFMLDKLFNCDFGDTERERVTNVLYLAGEGGILDCPIKIRKSDFKTPAMVTNSKPVCVLYLEWICEQVTSMLQIDPNNNQQYSLNHSTIPILFGESSASDSSTMSTQAQASLTSVNADELSEGESMTLMLCKDPEAEMYKLVFKNTQIQSREDYERAMGVLKTLEHDLRRSLKSGDAETRRLANLTKEVEAEEAKATQLKLLLSRKTTENSEQEAKLILLDGQYKSLTKEIAEKQEEARKGQNNSNALGGGGEENFNIDYLKKKLESLKVTLKVDEELLRQKEDEYLQKYPLLSSQIGALNEMIIRNRISCCVFFPPPVQFEKLDTWIDGALTTCIEVIEVITRRCEAGNAINQSTITEIEDSSGSGSSSDPPRILSFEKSPISTDSDSDLPRILITRN